MGRRALEERYGSSRATPEGEQIDSVEVMEIENGLIQRHRAYWGWFGFHVLKNGAYHS
jgi:hypothetical protein